MLNLEIEEKKDIKVRLPNFHPSDEKSVKKM